MGEKTKVGVAFAAIYLIWGSTYLAIGTAVTAIPPVFMVAARGLLAGGVLYTIARLRGSDAVRLSELLEMVPTALLLFGGGYVLVGWAEQSVASGPSALLNATTPAWVVLFEWLSGRRSRPNGRYVIALGLGVAGVAVLVLGGGKADTPVLPALALVVASVAWAAGTLRTRRDAHGNPMRNAAVQLLTGGLLLLPTSALLGEFPSVAAGFSAQSLWALTYLIVFGSLLGYSAYVWLLHHVPASKVASHSYVNPLIAVVVGTALANENLVVGTLVAGGLILVSVFFIVSEVPAEVPAFTVAERPKDALPSLSAKQSSATSTMFSPRRRIGSRRSAARKPTLSSD